MTTDMILEEKKASKENRYDWYEEDFTSFLLSLELPAYRKDMPVKLALSAEKKDFVSKFSEMICQRRYRAFSDVFYNELATALPKIKHGFDSLCKIIEAYDNADMASAQNDFDRLMDDLKGHFFISDIFWPYLPTNFFRVRVSEKEKLTNAKDLLHIPYTLRHLSGNERYSLAGHPCLYLASYLHIAWQECGYPHQYYYSEFQYQPEETEENEWKFITFLSPWEVATRWFGTLNTSEEDCLRLTIDYLLTYPLIFACSIVNLNGNSAFKPEYVIPQMLTQWVYRNYNEVKGIKYFSCYDCDDIQQYHGFNVVIPAKMKDHRKKYSEDITRKFLVSKPICLENKLGKGEADRVKKYKNDLIRIMHDSFVEADECLEAFYRGSDLLDKAIHYSDESDMHLVVSAVRQVAKTSRIVVKEFKKNEIVNSARRSPTYTSRTEKRIEEFDRIYDRYLTDIKDIAESFDLLFGNNNSCQEPEFFSVS